MRALEEHAEDGGPEDGDRSKQREQELEVSLADPVESCAHRLGSYVATCLERDVRNLLAVDSLLDSVEGSRPRGQDK